MSKILRHAWYTEFPMNQLTLTTEFAVINLHFSKTPRFSSKQKKESTYRKLF